MPTDFDTLSAESFLAVCKEGSAAAYRRFEQVLAALDDLGTRAAARRFLARIAAALARATDAGEDPAAFHFQIGTLALGREADARREGADGAQLLLLQFPSVFAPEEWSRTFFEGLARYSPHDFAGRTLAELGCGNGWVTLALARRSAPEKLYGLDINPRAITCARLNLYLNALAADGEPVLDADGKSLLDRVEFHESDLLGWVRERGLKLDRVIGCIPQVLDPNLGEIRAGAELSDELLVSLSNYTGHQGYLEDLFGLGLVARALEEAIEVMRPGGWVVLNLGGRPGREILRQMFCRRGFSIRPIWSTRIGQADDTDISPLAEIERSGRHRFEFYLGVHSDEPVSARTAQAYARAGGAIYHSLTVFDGKLRFPEAMNLVFAALHGEVWRPVRDALDLDYEDDARVEEKSAFLARLARLLPERRAFPYGETLGAQPFRHRFAEYLERYFAIPLAAENLVVLPERASALRNLFALYAPALSLVHPSLQVGAAGVSPEALGFQGAPAELLECPLRVDLAVKLIAALRPQLVATTLDPSDVRSPDSFLRLVEAAGRVGARLLVDISPFFELDSTPGSNGVLQALSEGPLPAHVAILCGLVRNRVYEDLEVCFLLTEDRELVAALEGAAELTYSRVPMLTQEYYDTILAELLSFRLDPLGSAVPGRRTRAASLPPIAGAAPALPIAERCRIAFAHPALVAENLPRTAATIRFDYGENALASPTPVATSLFEAFARRELSTAETDPSPELSQFLRRRFGLDVGGGRLAPRFVYGLGVAPLFSSLAAACAAEGGTFVFPRGSYGFFVATVDFFGGSRRWIATERANGFKVTPTELEAALAGVSRPWLYLNGPAVNPTGSLYSSDEMAALLAVAAKHRARVVIDILFSGLEHAEPVPWDLGPVLADHALSLVVLGGVSKELAAGGLRFGFAWCHGEAIERALLRGLTSVPHATTRFAAKRIFAALNRPSVRTREELSAQRQLLAERANRLVAVLADCGWEPLRPSGGLFLVARPGAYLGRKLEVATSMGLREWTLDSENIAEAMFWGVDLMINDSRWTGIPEHCRFVLSVVEDVFEEGLRRIRAFCERVTGGSNAP